MSIFTVVVYPNPFTSEFTVLVKTCSQEQILLNVYDLTGRLLQEIYTVKANTPAIIMNDLLEGFYILQVVQGIQHEKIKILKNR